MILPLGGLILGAIIGAAMAHRRGGKIADLLQWAIVMALVLGLAGLFVMIFILRAA